MGFGGEEAVLGLVSERGCCCCLYFRSEALLFR
jgi:hypothetical protein